MSKIFVFFEFIFFANSGDLMCRLSWGSRNSNIRTRIVIYKIDDQIFHNL